MAGKKAKKSKAVRKERGRDADVDSNDALVSSAGRSMPWFGWVGLAIMVVSEIALLLGFHPAATVFTPIMWTGYILFIDGWIWARGGRSYFKDEKLQWPIMALMSSLIWIMFEGFNFKMQAWEYFNRPIPWERNAIFIWAFATIIPAMLRTRSLFATFKFFDRSHPWRIKFTPFWLSLSFVVGIAFSFMPVMFNDYWANFLIPFTWVGFIFLLEPINYRMGAPSVYRDFEEGKVSFFYQVLLAGLVCGLLWESWNYQAVPHKGLVWVYYLNPLYWDLSFQKHIGEMPLLGFLGYPPFIWECYAIWEFCKWALQGDKMWKSPAVRV